MVLECPNTMAISSSHQRPWERVAQPVEHVTFNHGVLGSSPSALTNEINGLWHVLALLMEGMNVQGHKWGQFASL